MSFIQKFKVWSWRRGLNQELFKIMGLIASKAWRDRMFNEHFGKNSPKQAIRIEFCD